MPSAARKPSTRSTRRPAAANPAARSAARVVASAPVADPAVRARILREAREYLFTHGYSAFRLDDFSRDLGMSKKTLYVHFAGKDALLRSVIEALSAEVRADADALLGHTRLTFAEKLRGFSEGMLERMRALTPATLRDIQRCAPELHALVSEMRQQNIPYIFGRLIEQGQLAGLVRSDLPVGFATEFYLNAINGLLQPASLDRLQLAPREVVARAIELFFGGLLTAAGRKEHEKLFPR